MKQTAVEQLIELIKKDYKINGRLRPAYVFYILEQAKAMEKEQSLELIELTSQLTGVATVDKEIAEMEYIDVYNQYYNETFKSE